MEGGHVWSVEVCGGVCRVEVWRAGGVAVEEGGCGGVCRVEEGEVWRCVGMEGGVWSVEVWEVQKKWREGCAACVCA